MKRRIYLDYAATSPMLAEVKAAMNEVMDIFGNPSSLHFEGRNARKIIDNARNEVAKLINADPEEIIFTSGGTEANNLVSNSFTSVLTSDFEHPSMTKNVKKCKNPQLKSVMMANNEIGCVFDIERMALDWSADENAEKTEVKHYFHTDATQAVGKIKIDVKKLGVDYLTLSAHKIGGPKGVGALYIRNGAPIKKLLEGGHQEANLRAGTQNVVGIAGLGAAAKYAREKSTIAFYNTKVRELRDKLARGIAAKIPNITFNGAKIENDGITIDRSEFDEDDYVCDILPNILNASFWGIEGESIQLYLDAAGIAVSTGSACASGDGKPSAALMALAGDAERAHSSIRFSLGLETTEDDVRQTIRALQRVIKKLRSFSAASS